MSKKIAEGVNIDAKAMDVYAEKKAQQALTVQDCDKRFLEEGEKYNLYVCMEKARLYQEQMTNGLLGLGAQLILIKNHEEHGNFMTAVGELGLPYRSANYAMNAALKFGKLPTLATLGNSKLKALTVLDDEQIQDLVNGEVVTGVGTLDEIEAMTVRELRAALRAEKKKRKEEREAQEAAITQKEQKLNALEMELRYREPPTKEELAQAKLDEIKKRLFREVGEASHAVHCLMQTISEAQQIPDVNITQLQDFITLEPEDFLSSIFDYTDELDDMIENIRPDRSASETEVLEAEIINEE
ncbi:MAG: hypothetical protein P1P67_11320 [Treponema phagedenis]|uniref:hypothetical protein n=1 Tax=Treponema phagedenis TaxID=162 RepID=UPI003133D0ED